MYLVILLPLGMLVCGPPTNCGKVLDCPRCGGLFGEGFLGFSRLVCRWVVTCSWRVVYGIALGRDIGVNYGNIGVLMVIGKKIPCWDYSFFFFFL